MVVPKPRWTINAVPGREPEDEQQEQEQDEQQEQEEQEQDEHQEQETPLQEWPETEMRPGVSLPNYRQAR